MSLNFKQKPTFAAVAGDSPTSTTAPAATATAATTPAAAPNANRLAEPTLSPDPSQAEYGGREYWLNCMPCHGDRGQGLTDEFRQLYPEEDRKCWKSGCHGARPYENGFTLPASVPKIIGPGALDHFETAASLYNFIHSAMPYQAAGSLDEPVYWQLTAYLLWKNGLMDRGENLGSGNAAQIYLRQPAVVVVDTVSPASPGIQETPTVPGNHSLEQKPAAVEGINVNLLWILSGSALAVTAIAWVLIRFRNTPH